MNKRAILQALRTGYTMANIKVEELPYWLKPIFEERKGLKGIWTNGNKFWSYENRKNRSDLINDVVFYKKSLTHIASSHFHILNRMENGDRYGIELAS